MREIAKWVIAVGLLIVLALPKVSYACMPSMPYWKVTISDLQYPYNADLPNGLMFDISGNSITIENRTEHRATLGGLSDFNHNIIKANSTVQITKSDLYRNFFPANYSDDSAYYSAIFFPEDEVVYPPLTGKLELSLRHDGQLYKIPITAHYNIEYVPSDDGAGCTTTFIIVFLIPLITALVIAGVIAGLIISGIVKMIRRIKDRRAAP